MVSRYLLPHIIPQDGAARGRLPPGIARDMRTREAYVGSGKGGTVNKGKHKE